MSMRTKLKGLVHQELFDLEPAAKQAFKYSVVDERLRKAFRQNNHPLGSLQKFRPQGHRKWKLADDRTVYLVKDVGDHLAVLQEKHPRLCNVLESVLYDAKPRYYTFRWRCRQAALQRIWAFKKRWVDKPQKLLVNIGSGSWYVPDWKVLEYRGRWYSYYAPSFIDFPHDLTSNRQFPIADGSVDLFYSEHVIEHLKDGWCEHIFREAHRCLKSDGGFRIVVPDADLIYDRFRMRDTAFFKSWMDRDNASIAEAFRTLVGQARSPFDECDFERRLSGMSKEDFLNWCKQDLEYDWERSGEHINWFNFEKLARMLEKAGFCNVHRCGAQQSQFPEARGPGFDTRAWYSLHVECLKNRPLSQFARDEATA
jgi:predicted SAM-dependent methyltransferase